MAIENLKQRIGEIHTSGDMVGAVKRRPPLDVNGSTYGQMGTLAHLDSTRFVVLPPNFHNWPLIEEIKQELGIGVAAKRKSTKAEGSDGE